MVRYSMKNTLYLCTVLNIAAFASVTASLSLEELSLEMQQLKQSNEILTTKVSRLEELELKVQFLETVLIEQQKEIRTSHHSFQSALKGNANSVEKQGDQRNAMFRTCRELHQADPSLNSGMYWIDPDGQAVGDDPIYVHCDMATGKTSVLHDSEDPTDVGHCTNPGCYTRPVKYSASTRQMDALSELSSECHQSIRYDCNLAPFEISGDAQAWWNDRNGVAQYFWSGSNNSIHTCQCGIDHNCVEVYNNCNCDSSVPVPLSDSGIITDKKYLPITRLNFGRTQLETSSGVHTLGRFECTGQVSVSGMPKSCSDLWKIGYTLSGIHSVMGADYVETVYCDFAKLPYEQGFQTLIGYSDVKSSPIYFYVQKGASQNVTGTVPFDVTRLNTGGAMNASSGIFTAPQSGIYAFQLSGLVYYPGSTGRIDIFLALMLNGNEIGRTATDTNDDGSYYTHSLHSTLELKKDDQVWINVVQMVAGGLLYGGRYTHFTGYLLQEYVARS